MTAEATYDPTVGFSLNRTVDLEANYICSSFLQDNQYSYTPLDSRNQVSSQIYFNHSGDGAEETTVSCAIDEQQFDSLKLIVASCQSLTQCDLKFRPYDVSFIQSFNCKYSPDLSISKVMYTWLSQYLGKLTGEVTTLAVSNLTGGTVTTRLPFPAGLVGCVGLHSSNDSIIKYVRHFDYFFTGLDARPCK